MYLGANLSPRELFFFQAKGPNIIRDWGFHDGVLQDTRRLWPIMCHPIIRPTKLLAIEYLHL